MTERIKVVCPLNGYEKFWIEYDVSTWGMGTYVEIHKRLTIPQAITEFLPKNTTGWHIANADGTVIAHPGAGASAEVWDTVWEQFDVETSRALYLWLWTSILTAMQEAMAFNRKRLSDDSGDGAGVQGT